MMGGLGRVTNQLTVEPVQVNGSPAVAVYFDGELDGVMALLIEDGLISGLYYVRNPEKLSWMQQETTVSR
jgi:RNA polymerase sigma-70 factor (ECF subfamily)